MEQDISHARSSITDTVISLQNSEGYVIPEIHDLLGKTHDILYKAVYKWAGSADHI